MVSSQHASYQQAERRSEDRDGGYRFGQVRALWPLWVQTEHVRTVPELTLALAFGAAFALAAGLALTALDLVAGLVGDFGAFGMVISFG